MIQVLGRAIKIINIIADAPTAVSLKTISEKTKLNKSTCHHILETLIDNELIIKISASKGYILGPATFYWTRHGRFNNDFIILCDPVLKWLNKKINQTIILATIIKGNKYIIDYCESDVQLSKTKVQLLKDDIYRTATGRLLLANLDKDQIYEVYKKFGLPNEKDWPKIDSFEILLKNLAMIKNQKIYKTVDIPSNIEGPYNYIGYAGLIKFNQKVYGSIGVACKIEANKIIEYNTENQIIKYLLKALNEIIKRLKYNLA